MSDLTIALLTIFGTVASVTGVVLYVFNGTRALIKEMHQTQKEMQQTQKEMQQTQKGMQQTLEELKEMNKELLELQKVALKILERMEERAEKRHQEVVERLR